MVSDNREYPWEIGSKKTVDGRTVTVTRGPGSATILIEESEMKGPNDSGSWPAIKEEYGWSDFWTGLLVIPFCMLVMASVITIVRAILLIL